jgi:hypothetical protein
MTAQWMAGTEELLEGSTELGPVQEWGIGAARADIAFATGLRSAGLPDDEVAEALTVRDEYKASVKEAARYRIPGAFYFKDPVPVTVRQRRYSAWSRLLDWVSGRQVKVLESADIPVRIPLFLLGCADVEGCTAAFSHETAEARALKWAMTIYGSGLSGSRELSTSVSAKFSAAEGQVKMIFLDLTLPVEHIEITRDGRTIGSGFQIDGANVRPAASPGLYLLSAASPPPTRGEVTQFPLSGDTSRALSTYQWTYERSLEKTTKLGVEAFNSSLTLAYGSVLTDQIALTYELRGGHDYRLLAAAEGDGLLWAPTAGAVEG